jgi:hypothetical protein
MPSRPVTYFAVIALSVCIAACAPTRTFNTQTNQNYRYNDVMSSSVGSPMVEREQVLTATTRYWAGLAFGGWQEVSEKTDQSFKEELIYSGISQDTLRVTYREYKGDFARPAFFPGIDL